MLLAARRSAINASTDAQLQLFSLVIAAPEPIRARFRGQKLAAMLTAARLRVHSSWDTQTTSTVVALRALARRVHSAAERSARTPKGDHHHHPWLAPRPPRELGVGPIVAATVLCAWSHPGRIHSEAAFAMLAGVAPIPANSGQVTTRHRLNRYGDRHLNQALHTVVRIRIQYQPATRDLRRPPHRRRQDQPRDHTLPGSLRRPRPLPPPRKRGRNCLTNHRSVAPGWTAIGWSPNAGSVARCPAGNVSERRPERLVREWCDEHGNAVRRGPDASTRRDVHDGRVVAQRDATLEILNPRPGERVLDVGSGPGFLAAGIASRVGESGAVSGIDVSGPMIAYASGLRAHPARRR